MTELITEGNEETLGRLEEIDFALVGVSRLLGEEHELFSRRDLEGLADELLDRRRGLVG